MHFRRHASTLVQEVRYALRGFRRAPQFSLATVAAIALGVGLNTAVFSVVDRILFRSLPYPQDDRLVSFGMTAPIAPRSSRWATTWIGTMGLRFSRWAPGQVATATTRVKSGAPALRPRDSYFLPPSESNRCWAATSRLARISRTRRASR
jgi:hypothetical protein